MKITPTGRYALLLTASLVLGLDPVRAILLALVFSTVWTIMVDKKAWVYFGGAPQDFPPEWIYDLKQRMDRA